MLSGHRVRSFGWVESLLGPWEGTSEGAKFLNFGDGSAGIDEFFVGTLLLQLLLPPLNGECFLHLKT